MANYQEKTAQVLKLPSRNLQNVSLRRCLRKIEIFLYLVLAFGGKFF